MGLPAGPAAGVAFVKTRFVDDLDAPRRKGLGQFGVDHIADGHKVGLAKAMRQGQCRRRNARPENDETSLSRLEGLRGTPA
jgi:hypothetical protein